MQTSLFFVALSSFISLSIGLSFYDRPVHVTLTLQSGDIQSQIEFLLELETLKKGLKNSLSSSLQHCGTKSRKTNASGLGSMLSKADCSFEPLCKRRYLASAILKHSSSLLLISLLRCVFSSHVPWIFVLQLRILFLTKLLLQ